MKLHGATAIYFRADRYCYHYTASVCAGSHSSSRFCLQVRECLPSPPLSTCVIALALSLATACLAQPAKPSPPYPTHLSYAFSNFVWWTDADLRAQLKKRIPGLGDE